MAGGISVSPTPSPSPSSSAAGGAGSSAPQPYLRVRLLDAGDGVFTSGAGADWSAQFEDAPVTSLLSTLAGEVHLDAITTGACVEFAWETRQPYLSRVWVEASVGANLQMSINGDVSEVSASGLVSIVSVKGWNVLKLTRESGPIILMGRIFDSNDGAPWRSLYTGADPLTGASKPSPIRG